MSFRSIISLITRHFISMCLDLECAIGSLVCAMAPLLSQYNGIESTMLGTMPSSVITFLIQIASLAASKAAINSASVVESTVEPYFEQRQLIAQPLRVNMYHDVDFLSYGSLWKSESV